MHRDEVTKITATSSSKDELKRFLGLKPFEHLEYSWVQHVQRIKFLAGAPQRVNMVNCFATRPSCPWFHVHSRTVAFCVFPLLQYYLCCCGCAGTCSG